MTGIESIIKEREKQINKHGYTAQHDSMYKNKELMFAAMAYLNSAMYGAVVGEEDWPFDEDYWHPGSPEDDLAKAAAFIAAELDRRRENAE